jgi:hypothetical protein
MGFWTTNMTNFNLGAVAIRMHGIGSSNVLCTLAVWWITNTYFTATDSIEHFPRNFQPNIDSRPLGIPVFGTNLDFYYWGAATGDGLDDQILVLAITNTAYQVLIHSNSAYAIEITSDTVGNYANGEGLFMWDYGNNSDEFQYLDFPPTCNSDWGWATGGAGGCHDVLARILHRTFTDPETYAGEVSGSPEAALEAIMAVYAAPPSYIKVSGVSRMVGNTVLTWNGVAGATYSVFRTNVLTSPTFTTNWQQLVTGYPINGAAAGSLSYTDTTATANLEFYRIRSP